MSMRPSDGRTPGSPRPHGRRIAAAGAKPSPPPNLPIATRWSTEALPVDRSGAATKLGSNSESLCFQDGEAAVGRGPKASAIALPRSPHRHKGAT